MCGYSDTQLKQGWGIISGILPFTAYFPRTDIHELLAPDILHQIIKGTFKDHIVAWVGEYFLITYGEKKAEQIWADIDRHIAVVPSFPGLRHFPQGQRFKQWTGDDSKALMKVFLPAIAGHVPEKMLRAIRYFLDFCYVVRRSSLDEADLDSLQTALEGFHDKRTVFMDVSVRPNGISLPQQHSLCHYGYLTQQFGTPNGLCSSLTESKHHKAVKEPWRHSSGWLPLDQMLVTNHQLDKLASFQAGKFAIGLLDHPLLPPGVEPIDPDANHSDMEDAVADEGDDKAEVIVQLAKRQVSSYPRCARAIGEMIGTPSFPSFYAASDICEVNGMICYTIRVAHSWRGGPARHDCVFIEHDPTLPGFRGLYVAQVILLFSFTFRSVEYPCALVRWFSTIGDQPCPNTELDDRREHLLSVVHLDTILRPFLDHDLTHTDSLIAFQAFYVNRFSDYHTFEISF
ncbi:uncharacterized protein F5147DRAFT_748031 [Suillus discolor]|uniref:Uncharacterized protein n=1 Tax=Suillus discolor TaxID=1912936 RepID=A0A9P7EUT6_9AGAM|nr:uncharacterized protein F5147DRAFT_748031 [Suillus discolor]KAG2092296.1 hypothetical protein F5147DRAFT_748031 [Suillus discolor]